MPASALGTSFDEPQTEAEYTDDLRDETFENKKHLTGNSAQIKQLLRANDELTGAALTSRHGISTTVF